MGDPKGFMKVKRQKTVYRKVDERKYDFKEVFHLRDEQLAEEQASRCMDCGTPFCHWSCPLGNLIPEWNDMLFKDNWKQAFELLESTNNLPEVTGRVCPALCEAACVLAVNDDAVTIREDELDIIEQAFEKGYITPQIPEKRTGKKVAVVGSGPAGIAAADQLNQAGHNVTLFEKDDKLGGILRYGIPDFKLDKNILDRRFELLGKEGVKFKTGVNVGVDYSTEDLLKGYDAVCLTGGSREPRDLDIEGRDLDGIHFAMDFLIQANRLVAGETVSDELITAKDKHVIVIGGGDTGNDCVGVSIRQGAKSVKQLELMPKAPEERTDEMPWPLFPRLHKVSTSHEEGGERDWEVLTKRFIGDGGQVKGIECVRVKWEKDDTGRWKLNELPDTEFDLQADLVILAMGFIHPEHNGLLDSLGVEYDKRGNVQTDKKYKTSVNNVYSAGDMRRGQSLVVWALAEGRNAAAEIDEFLMGETKLPRNGIEI